MSELEHMTLREAVTELRERVERSRRVEENARIDRERYEAALTALTRLMEGAEDTGHPVPSNGAAPEGRRLLGLAAVREVMREQPEQTWTPREIHEVLEQRGWLSGEAQYPRAGTESAVGRLLRKGEIAKVGRGQYRWASGQEALTGN